MPATLTPPPATTGPAPKHGTNPRRQLATYQAADETRTIYGQRVDGTVRLTDVGPGRSYLVESGIDTNASLTALLTDYLQQAEQLASCPMAKSVLGDYLHQLAD